MKTTISLLAASALALAGCHKAGQIEKPNTAPLPKVSIDGEASTPAPAAVSANAPESSNPPPPDAPAAEPQQLTASEEMSLVPESLNSVLRDYYDAESRVPKDLEEMVQLKLIPRVPTPPPGKKYVIDATKRRVVLVSK